MFSFLFQLKTSKEKEDYDCFILQEVSTQCHHSEDGFCHLLFCSTQVSEDLLDIFNYVAGIVPVLSSHIEMVIFEDTKIFNDNHTYC